MNRRHRQQKSGDDGGSSKGGWEVVYSGFVLIMLCFFIMLSSFASIQQGKVMRFVKSFVDSVSILSGGLHFTAGKRVLPPSPDIVDKESELADVFGRLQHLIRKFELEKELDLEMTAKGIEMRFSARVLFQSGAADIRPEALPFLKKIGGIIRQTQFAVQIEGHTDNIPIHTPMYPSNWELSTSRAVKVLRYFVANDYVAPTKISAVGCGEFRPLVDNDGPAQRAKNRRVEILLIRGDEQQNREDVNETQAVKIG